MISSLDSLYMAIKFLFFVVQETLFSFPSFIFQRTKYLLDRIISFKKFSIFISGWSVGLEFYYTDYDWGLVYRAVGEEVIYKTRYNLKSHLESHPNWTPQSENLTAVLGRYLSLFFG